MPIRVRIFEDTPNPNAIKCVLESPLKVEDGGLRSFFNRDAAAQDPLARSLLEIEGVSHVLIRSDWITVSKVAGARWASIKPAIQKVLGGLRA